LGAVFCHSSGYIGESHLQRLAENSCAARVTGLDKEISHCNAYKKLDIALV